MRLLVAIPVFNEHRYVDDVLDKVKSFGHDILVIDDGSTDGTSQLLARRDDVEVVRHPLNLGYGSSIIDSFRHADRYGYDWVITMDCDRQHEPATIPDFVDQIETDRWDIISGSRYMRPRPDDDLPPSDRRSINATITQVCNGLFPFQLTDAFCGFKAHRVSAIRNLRLDERGYAFPMQLWPRVARFGLRVTEIPVRLIYNDPNRHFGGNLDDPQLRLAHYLEKLWLELSRSMEIDTEEPVCNCCDCA